MSAGFVEAVGWTLLNFTWQGALIACETALHLVLLRNASAQARYAVACTGLLLCLLWPLASLWLRLSGDSAADGGVALMLPDHRPASGLHGGRLLPLPLLLHLHDARFLRPDPLLQGLHVQAGAHLGLACGIQRGQQSIAG